MSRIPSVSSKGAIPKQVSKTGSKTKQQKGKGKAAKDPKKDVIEWQLPALSVPQKDKQSINWEKLRKDSARRLSPEGEDIKEIRRILKEVKNVDVSVHEFINMISPYTSDNGTALRSVMAEDLEAFRKLAKKVYETMTQDVSDVLVNEQLQMVQYYEEKTAQLSEKMMRAIDEIYEMAPQFEFDKYLKDKDDYLQTLFPIPKDAEVISDENVEMMRRQQAYHRLQWLKSEGERMSEENKRLMRRFEELKKEQQLEQERAAERAAEAEAKRQELAQEETEMKEKLEQLNESIEKSFIRDEQMETQKHNKAAMEPPPPEEDILQKRGATGAVRKTASSTGMKKQRHKKPEWSTTTAADIEEQTMKETVAMETKPKRTGSRTAVKRPKGPKPRQTSPFHYSPPKTPPQEAQMEETAFMSFGTAKPKAQAKPPSPFHYSPPRTPPEERGAAKPTSPFHYSPPRSPPLPAQKQETKIEETSTTVQVKRPQPRVRQRCMAPKDTWGGFY